MRLELRLTKGEHLKPHFIAIVIVLCVERPFVLEEMAADNAHINKGRLVSMTAITTVI